MARGFSRSDIKAAGVQRAYQRALAKDAVGQRSAFVGTRRLCGKDGTITASEYRDGHSVDLKQPALAERDSVDASKIGSDPCCHHHAPNVHDQCQCRGETIADS